MHQILALVEPSLFILMRKDQEHHGLPPSLKIDQPGQESSEHLNLESKADFEKKFRSSSVAVTADPAPSRNSETFRRRFSRTLSIYDDNDTGSGIKTNGVTSNGITSGHEEDSSEYKYTSGYVRYYTKLS